MNTCRLAALLVLALLLTACGPPAQPLAGNSPAPTDQPELDVTLPSQPAPTSRPAATELPTAAALPTATLQPSATPSPTATATNVPTAAAVPSASPSPTPTLTPTDTPLPTPTLTPTFAFPQAVIQMQANCRYGPGTAYLYSHGLYSGDRAEVHGRTASGTWLWIKPENLERRCWAAASVMQVTGDIFTVRPIAHVLPRTTFAGPPTGVQAVRSGNQVTVSWDGNSLSEDKFRGFLIEATLCQAGHLIWSAVQTNSTSYTFTDETSCSGASSALLYTAEKHGYSDPVQVRWP